MFFLGHCCVVPWSKNGLGSGLFLLFVLALIETETDTEADFRGNPVLSWEFWSSERPEDP